MTWTDKDAAGLAPSLDDLAALARQVFDRLPADFRRQVGGVALRVEDFASDAVLDAQGVGDPFELTGLYQAADPAPPTLTVYRRPLLDEWCERGEVSLDALIAHVLVDELAQLAPAPAGLAAGLDGPPAPTLEDFVAIAGRALRDLPSPIRAAVGDVQIRVEEFADDETLDSLEIDDPFELTGVYEGVDLTRRSLFDAAPGPSSIRLFRRPILDEWCEGEVGFQALVEHVLVHEIAHHFGFSDDGIHQVERS